MMNADTVLGLFNSRVLQYKKVTLNHALFWVPKCSLAYPKPC